MTSKVAEYIVEEVSRQGHDVTKWDGLYRVKGMLDAWLMALSCADMGEKPKIAGLNTLARHIEPCNDGGIRYCTVKIGNKLIGPNRINEKLVTLFEQQAQLSPIEFYKAFEEIHPYRDGNGRLGKILLNWLNGTLLDPIFPPANLWGNEIRNP